MTQLAIFKHESVNPFDLRPEHIHIEWIAPRLHGIRRFGGDGPSTVLEHSYMVMLRTQRMTTDPELRAVFGMQALLHDAAEALLGDICRPLKNSMGFMMAGEFVSFAEVEARILARIFRRYDLPTSLLPQVEDADNAECLRELKAYRMGEHSETASVCVTRFIGAFRALQMELMEAGEGAKS
jgi:hypothetical protein